MVAGLLGRLREVVLRDQGKWGADEVRFRTLHVSIVVLASVLTGCGTGGDGDTAPAVSEGSALSTTTKVPTTTSTSAPPTTATRLPPLPRDACGLFAEQEILNAMVGTSADSSPEEDGSCTWWIYTTVEGEFSMLYVGVDIYDWEELAVEPGISATEHPRIYTWVIDGGDEPIELAIARFGESAVSIIVGSRFPALNVRAATELTDVLLSKYAEN